MTRLQSQLRRLFVLPAAEGDAGVSDGTAAAASLPFIAPTSPVRALMLEVARPADWTALSAVWRAVQADLSWPAPAIAVSGADGMQLWFSLQSPVPAAQAHAVLDALTQRHLAAIPRSRVALLPRPDTSPGGAYLQASPAVAEVRSDQWSAFIAPDLAPIFSDTPWLDVPPGAEGQADLLQPLRSIKPAEWDEAMKQLNVSASAKTSARATEAAPEHLATDALPALGAAAPTVSRAHTDDPRAFLLRVMNDDSVPMALRIEAAKALLHTTTS
ncbi:hypothetical protein [Roseateles amylovorans]|uniref:DUF4123 domain-containing protein n=1 Tax=Roseateles amylovorans TaxID=2978473 RepID=A0ABY6B5R6_9BURK|nr:hypothetical protein [Roseateles amylovorans]UXH80746.1 hypothetical protein N4261_13075 [Roseateles amylovorans]